ncbi:MAG: hypothetical protein WDZ63_09430 [Burkholderiales bacterium]
MSAIAHSASVSRPASRGLWPFHLGAFADVVVGLDLVLFADHIARLAMPHQATILGFEPESVMRGLGVFLILFAIETVVVARSSGALARFRAWVVAANWATVALAAIVIAFWHGAFSAIGIAGIAAIGLALAVLSTFQQRAL